MQRTLLKYLTNNPGVLVLPVSFSCSRKKRDLSGLPFTKSFRKTRLESKWSTTFWVVLAFITGVMFSQFSPRRVKASAKRTRSTRHPRQGKVTGTPRSLEKREKITPVHVGWDRFSRKFPGTTEHWKRSPVFAVGMFQTEILVTIFDLCGGISVSGTDLCKL